MAELYDENWEYVKNNINDIDFQLHFQKVAKKRVGIKFICRSDSIILINKVTSTGEVKFHYQIPDDPYENMVSFCYCRSLLRTSFEVITLMP